MRIMYQSIRHEVERALERAWNNGEIKRITYIRLTVAEYREAEKAWSLSRSCGGSMGFFNIAWGPPAVCRAYNPADGLDSHLYQFRLVCEGSPEDRQRG